MKVSNNDEPYAVTLTQVNHQATDFLLQVALLQTYPNLKQLVKMAVEKSVQELMPPVVERTNKITLTTCEQIIKKVLQNTFIYKNYIFT